MSQQHQDQQAEQQVDDIERDMGGECVHERLPPIDYELDRFPYCIVGHRYQCSRGYSPLLVTWASA